MRLHDVTGIGTIGIFMGACYIMDIPLINCCILGAIFCFSSIIYAEAYYRK